MDSAVFRSPQGDGDHHRPRGSIGIGQPLHRTGLEGTVVRVLALDLYEVAVAGVFVEAFSKRGAPLCVGDYVTFVDDVTVDPRRRPSPFVQHLRARITVILRALARQYNR